jgi:hypothetical protein
MSEYAQHTTTEADGTTVLHVYPTRPPSLQATLNRLYYHYADRQDGCARAAVDSLTGPEGEWDHGVEYARRYAARSLDYQNRAQSMIHPGRA